MFEIKKVQRILKCNSNLKNRQANIWHDPTITTKENKQFFVKVGKREASSF